MFTHVVNCFLCIALASGDLVTVLVTASSEDDSCPGECLNLDFTAEDWRLLSVTIILYVGFVCRASSIISGRGNSMSEACFEGFL